MGSAMVTAWLDAGLIAHIDILDPNGVPSSLIDATVTAYADEQSFMEKSASWDMLVIAVKPQTMKSFCAAIQKRLPPSLPVLSIAAGQTLASFAAGFGPAQPVIRAMPNTPAAIGKGMTVACANAGVSQPQKTIAADLLSTLGLIEWVEDEQWLDAVTALSGSGPAYVFYLIEAMANAGTKAGLPPDFAMKLARQTVIGAAALADHAPQTPAATLRQNVTSPGGTTEAALSVLMEGVFQKIMDEAIKTAAKKSKDFPI